MNKEQPEALPVQLANRLCDGISTGHDWPNTDDELLRMQSAAELRRQHAEIEALRAQIGHGEPSQAASDAYDRIDRFLRQRLDDHDYAHYSFDLDLVWGAATAPQQKTQPLSDDKKNKILSNLRRQEGWDGDGWDFAVIEATEAAHNIGEKK